MEVVGRRGGMVVFVDGCVDWKDHKMTLKQIGF